VGKVVRGHRILHKFYSRALARADELLYIDNALDDDPWMRVEVRVGGLQG
jgi:hypothetical protein